MKSSLPRPVRVRVATLLALLVAAAALAPAARAADAFQYWSYWWGAEDGTWAYAATGPADRVVVDGDVEGWRFVATAEAVPDQPREAPDFDSICADAEPTDGMVRVAVVIDLGTEQDSPEASTIPEGQNPQMQCASVAEGSTGEQVLAAVVGVVRSETGAVCGISGYPATGCFEVVAEPAEPAAAHDEPSDLPVWPIVAGFVVLAAIAVLIIARKKGANGS